MDNHEPIEFKPTIETSVKAQEEYWEHGKVETVRCERCHGLLGIARLGDSALKVSCSCGLYNDTLRGL